MKDQRNSGKNPTKVPANACCRVSFAPLIRVCCRIAHGDLDDQQRAQELLERLLLYSGRSIRVGLTGVPGAGKSSLIDMLRCRLRVLGVQLLGQRLRGQAPLAETKF